MPFWAFGMEVLSVFYMGIPKEDQAARSARVPVLKVREDSHAHCERGHGEVHNLLCPVIWAEQAVHDCVQFVWSEIKRRGQSSGSVAELGTNGTGVPRKISGRMKV